MSTNDRIFYACQAVAITNQGDDIVAAPDLVHGLQSVGMTTNFNLEQAFELGQIEIYENIEGTPDIEVTLEKVLDGRPLIYHMASTGVDNTDASGLVARSKQQCDVRLGIFDEEQNSIAQGDRTSEVEVYCSGLFVSSISYTIPVDGNATESVTLVGNNKTWLTGGDVGITAESVDGFDGNDGPLIGVPGYASGGIVRREDVFISGSILPQSIRGVVGSGYSNAFNHTLNENRVHIQSFSVSTDFGREDVLELGRKTPYTRPANFPIEISCEIEAITSSGDFVFAYEHGDPALNTTTDSGNNTQNEIIYLSVRQGYGWDLGNKNRLASVSYGGGDAGGGNATCSYSYTNFNDLDVQNIVQPCPFGFGGLKNGAEGATKFSKNVGQGVFPTNLYTSIT
jgi:hypothetical protein